jgi:hypothetical protein
VRRRDIPEYGMWKNMRARCNSLCNKNIGCYQKNNIKVCSEWDDFQQFLNDMGKRPSEKHSLDRIDNNKGYSKENCRWVTFEIQAKNRGDFNKKFTYKNETMILKDWARKFKIHYTTLYIRIYREGLKFEEAISRPLRIKKYFYIDGEYTLKQLSEKYNVPLKILCGRINAHKWTLERALSEIIIKRKNNG